MSCGNPHETDCTEVLDRVYEYLDNELEELDCAKIRQHLDECGPCLKQYDLDLALKALIRRSCACEPAPQELRTKILTRITMVRIELEG
ncbi:mycothiol system anti-sigma-R factor [Angustibacter sp. Root456]|uniref:mycothiol system anti-sigma-R factor n=1 Tax=Angustibacter sp. Root456 TaxID=1736539 RepID=UPI0007002B6C|nr:mycothiol system anti-sigma-R factor [Angustibacter sp. Root456]KQX69728.1 anti-sigma factor [Angustibacter sp. Root456]